MQRSNPSPPQPFQAFFREWLIRQESFLSELENSIHHRNQSKAVVVEEEEEKRHTDLIGRVSNHYNQYYDAKSRVAQDNIFLVFSPTWFTPFEKTFLWIAGFKPLLAFHLVKTFITDLDEDQLTLVEEAKAETMLEEKDFAEEFSSIQETIAAPPMLEMARRAATAVDGELVGLEAALESLKKVMEVLLECADFLRLKTVMRIMEILRSNQNVVFFAVVARFQLQVRRWGLEREAAASASFSG